MPNHITRSTVNEQQYSAPDFQKSGFQLSYRRYTNFMLGRLHVGGFHWTMPGDKISGQTKGECTFERIVTPIVSPVNAMQYNIYLPLRPLDRSFKKGMTPTKLNSMSANWTMPLFNTRYLVDQVLRAYFDDAYNASSPTLSPFFDVIGTSRTSYASYKLSDLLPDLIAAGVVPIGTTVEQLLYDRTKLGLVSSPVYNLITTGTRFADMADDLYLRDALIDIAANITAKCGSTTNPISDSMLVSDFLDVWLDALLSPFVGRYSYYAEFKYEFLRPLDIYRLSHSLIPTQAAGWTGFLANFSETPQNEYAIRAMFAVWYELFRNVDLEPVSPSLPDWQEWSSTSIFDMSAGGNLLYLIYRIRPWENDMFISAQIDDLSRHVYAPIISRTEANGIGYHEVDMDNLDTNPIPPSATSIGAPQGAQKPSIYKLTYQDQLSGNRSQVQVPVPANVNDVLSSLDNVFTSVYGLDLNTLRQSQMLERYLKRNYLFGDEYQDRMLAHYQSRVSDMRINKPEVLSRSLDGYNMGQQVSNVSTDETKVGDRTATATVQVNGEQFTTFCEEFGIVISLVCFMPRSMYDGTCPQNYLSKQVHMPLPEFAANNEEFGRKTEIAGSGLAPVVPDSDSDNRYMFGRYQAYHAWRSRTDEVGGKFLDEMQDCTFRRFFGMFSDDTTPKLNYFFIHCRPNLNMFADNVAYDGQVYGDLVHECYVERVLPTPVEVI